MKLAEFIIQQRESIEEFYRWYMKKFYADRNNFPLNVNEADWVDYFAMWCENKKNNACNN